ncbi:RidA family protein [Georgenia sp. SYP-B2076]|uniref:RidA family protein n=1 Tax=Georgenia sp. SYP-B2076 TaxID=2495881 RepID=UPI000F8F050B|nr:RidA family protein [Georgenia sp. SYP-B2076]
MPRTLVSPPQMHLAPSYSHYAIAEGSTLICFAGQVALDNDMEIVGPGDLHAQTVAAMRNLETAMGVAGVGWDDIVRRTIYTTEPHELEALGSAIKEVTGDAENPPQTIVGVTGLALPELLVEIECTAVIA